MKTKPDSMTQARVWLQRACLRPAGSIGCVCLLCLSLFLAGTPVWAQQSVTGRVVDDRTGEPVPYATVYDGFMVSGVYGSGNGSGRCSIF